MTAVPRGVAPAWLDVSRETLARMDAFLALVEKWQPTINLVAKASLPVAWERHVLDSAQLFEFCPVAARHWVDLGSGGGFPGIIIALLAAETRPELQVTLVESDKRKATFLMQAARQLDLRLNLVKDRAETLSPVFADVMSARALAPLVDICRLAAHHLAPGGIGIFPKGAQAASEVAVARALWQFDATLLPSHTDPAGRIVIMKNLHHA